MPAVLLSQIVELKDLHVFREFRATTDLPVFRKYNLVYGFNGCGKTTLSRILACLETGALDPLLPDVGSFKLRLTDSSTISKTTRLDALKGRVFVFNEQFVHNNFEWHTSKVHPVFFIGTEQREIFSQIEAKERSLAQLLPRHSASEAEAKAAEDAFSRFKRDTAREISEQLNLGRRYNAPNLDDDYLTHDFTTAHILDDAERASLRSLMLQETSELTLARIAYRGNSLVTARGKTEAICTTSLESITLSELHVHDSMLGWAQEGLRYHQESQLRDCLFCGSALTRDRLSALAKALDGRFATLNTEIDAEITSLAAIRRHLADLASQIPVLQQITTTSRGGFATKREALVSAIDAAKAHADMLESKLRDKKAATTTELALGDELSQFKSTQIDNLLTDAVRGINAIIDAHNTLQDEFEGNKVAAADRLKLHYLCEKRSDYKELQDESQRASGALAAIVRARRELEAEIESLRRRVRQHGPPADVMNSMICAYLGHDELQIVAVDEGYQLWRGGKQAEGPPSEGERTAIVLCYFLVLLKGENRDLKNLIVVLDDPISSLDTRAMNYAAALLQSSLEQVGQLFLLTHNLQFMNEIKKWLKPKTESGLLHKSKAPANATAAMYFIETVQPGGRESRSSKLVELPKHIREYESEYQYLFHLMLRCKDRQDGREQYFYVMPNALRKLLDVFLAFKEPGGMGFVEKLKKVQKGSGLDPTRLTALERLAQAESHADNLDDLVSFSSMTVEELDDAIAAAMDFIQRIDKLHFDRMCDLCKP